MTKTIRLLIADDNTIMREGLKQLLALADDLQVVAEAENGNLVLQRLRQGGIDLLLFDMNMSDLSGENSVARIHAEHPNQKMLVLSMQNEPQIAQKALRSGATGYLCKTCKPETLLTAIRRVASGARFIDPQIAERIAMEACGLRPQAHHVNLTDREFQIMQLFARGASVTRIAEELAISGKTVSTHKARLMEKMGFTSNAEIIRYALAEGLAE